MKIRLYDHDDGRKPWCTVFICDVDLWVKRLIGSKVVEDVPERVAQLERTKSVGGAQNKIETRPTEGR